jgi:hypothetical protein
MVQPVSQNAAEGIKQAGTYLAQSFSWLRLFCNEVLKAINGGFALVVMLITLFVASFMVLYNTITNAMKPLAANISQIIDATTGATGDVDGAWGMPGGAASFCAQTFAFINYAIPLGEILQLTVSYISILIGAMLVRAVLTLIPGMG